MVCCVIGFLVARLGTSYVFDASYLRFEERSMQRPWWDLNGNGLLTCVMDLDVKECCSVGFRRCSLVWFTRDADSATLLDIFWTDPYPP